MLLCCVCHYYIYYQQIRNRIIADGGSVQDITEISDELKEIYRTVWELPQRSLLDMAADRGVYIDQSQSLNTFIPRPDYGKLTSMHFHGWKNGLKTGMYYLRTKPAAKAIQFTVDKSYLQKINKVIEIEHEINRHNNKKNSNNSDKNESDNDDSSDENNDNNSSNGSSNNDNGNGISVAPSVPQLYGDVCESCSG